MLAKNASQLSLLQKAPNCSQVIHKPKLQTVQLRQDQDTIIVTFQHQSNSDEDMLYVGTLVAVPYEKLLL